MTSTEAPPPGPETGGDGPDDGLADFGHSQTLDRSIGKFASFAAGISYISIPTTGPSAWPAPPRRGWRAG